MPAHGPPCFPQSRAGTVSDSQYPRVREEGECDGSAVNDAFCCVRFRCQHVCLRWGLQSERRVGSAARAHTCIECARAGMAGPVSSGASVSLQFERRRSSRQRLKRGCGVGVRPTRESIRVRQSQHLRSQLRSFISSDRPATKTSNSIRFIVRPEVLFRARGDELVARR